MAIVKLEVLRLDSLALMYPQIEQLFQKHLSVVRLDLQNRPGDVTARKISLNFLCTPVKDVDTGDLDEVVLEVSAASTVPVFKTKKFHLKPIRDGLAFNSEIPDELDQPALM